MCTPRYGVLDTLKQYVEDKKDANARGAPGGRSLRAHTHTHTHTQRHTHAHTHTQPAEGALLAFECLCEKLGRLFEPYVIHTLPLLLGAFGDGSPAVREASADAARAIMGQLSACESGRGGLPQGEGGRAARAGEEGRRPARTQSG